MLIHPFSDQSGVCLYSTETTIVTSLGVTAHELDAILSGDTELTSDHKRVLDELLLKDFLITHAKPRT